MVGNFNSQLHAQLFVNFDEAVVGVEGMNIIKNMITDQYMVVEKKGQDAFKAPSFLRWVWGFLRGGCDMS